MTGPLIEPTDPYHQAGVYCGEPAHCGEPYPGALPGTPYPPPPCPSTVETRGTVVRCGKPADDHYAHLGRHDGWDVVW